MFSKNIQIVNLVLLVILVIMTSLLVLQNGSFFNPNRNKELKIVAELIASDHEGAVGGIRQLLISVSSNPVLLSADSTTCQEILERQTIVFPYFFNLGVVDLAGNIICTGVPIQDNLNFTADTDFKELLSTKSFTVSGFRISQTTGRPSVRFFQPILDKQGKMVAAVFVSFASEWLNGFSPSFPIPNDITITKFDKDGNVFMRYPNPTIWSGTNQYESGLFQQVIKTKEGIMRTKGLDGVTRTYYIRPIYLDGKLNAYVVVGQ